MTQDELSTIGKVIWRYLANVGLTGNEDCATARALAAVEMAAAKIANEADQRIAELEDKLRAWEETAEHYCSVNTPISADGVRGYIAGLKAQLAAANKRIVALETAIEPFALMDRPECDLNEVACERGTASDMTVIMSADFRRASAGAFGKTAASTNYVELRARQSHQEI